MQLSVLLCNSVSCYVDLNSVTKIGSSLQEPFSCHMELVPWLRPFLLPHGAQHSHIVEKDVSLETILLFWTSANEVLSWYDNITLTDGEVPEEHSVQSVLIDVQSSATGDKLMNGQVGSRSHVRQLQCNPVASTMSIYLQLAAQRIPVREDICVLHTDCGHFVLVHVHKIVDNIGNERCHGPRRVLPLGGRSSWMLPNQHIYA